MLSSKFVSRTCCCYYWCRFITRTGELESTRLQKELLSFPDTKASVPAEFGTRRSVTIAERISQIDVCVSRDALSRRRNKPSWLPKHRRFRRTICFCRLNRLKWRKTEIQRCQIRRIQMLAFVPPTICPIAELVDIPSHDIPSWNVKILNHLSRLGQS